MLSLGRLIYLAISQNRQSPLIYLVQQKKLKYTGTSKREIWGVIFEMCGLTCLLHLMCAVFIWSHPSRKCYYRNNFSKIISAKVTWGSPVRRTWEAKPCEMEGQSIFNTNIDPVSGRLILSKLEDIHPKVQVLCCQLNIYGNINNYLDKIILPRNKQHSHRK